MPARGCVCTSAPAAALQEVENKQSCTIYFFSALSSPSPGRNKIKKLSDLTTTKRPKLTKGGKYFRARFFFLLQTSLASMRKTFVCALMFSQLVHGSRRRKRCRLQHWRCTPWGRRCFAIAVSVQFSQLREGQATSSAENAVVKYRLCQKSVSPWEVRMKCSYLISLGLGSCPG